MSATQIVCLFPGAMRDEHELKLTGRCPKCGEPFRNSLAIRSISDVPARLHDDGVT